jgi:hypothetical protein
LLDGLDGDVSRLTIHNCNAVIVYPPDKPGPYSIADGQMIEYTFVVVGELAGQWIVSDGGSMTSARSSIFLDSKFSKSINVFCVNGKFNL